ncbi:MAG: transcriptional regulator [Methanomassiliicoccales archaeon]|nr:MAG: transcriptional regulator [Methanomassiliicoccales archaeon]
MEEESNCRENEECLCPIRGIINVVSRKWAICIVSQLQSKNPLRYSEIKATLREISPKALSDTLRKLREEGLVERSVYPETPPRVEYSLTSEGKELKTALAPLVKWVREKTKRSDV